jgi:hypothetical protein
MKPAKFSDHVRAGDGLPFRAGDRVQLIIDPRHIGRVNAVYHGGAAVMVQWLGSRWKSQHDHRELQKAASD